jgi:hypothetical protein
MRRALLLSLFAGFAACAPADSGPSRNGSGMQGGSGAGGQAVGGGGATASGGSGAGGTAGSSAGGSSGAAGTLGAGGSAGGSGASGAGNAGAAGAAGGGTAGSVGTGVPSGDPILDRLRTTDVTVPAGAKAGTRNWRVWESIMLKIAPVYTAPLANCGTIICYTSGSGSSPNARAVRLGSDDALAGSVDLGAGLECRGIAAEPDGHFAALLWNGATDQIWVKRYDLAGTEVFATELTNDDNKPTDFGLGEARMEFGDGKYGVYYHVHSDSGHEGDTLKYVAAATGAEETQWSWGCSHSMSNLLTYSAAADSFLATCVTDCYPGTMGSSFATTAIGGIYLDNRRKVMDVAAGCNGKVAGELGGAAVAATGWKLVFNAHRGPVALGQNSYDTAAMNQDIAFASVGTNHMLAGEVVWLTETAGSNEADSAMARWQPAGDDAEQYIIGWRDPKPAPAYKLSRVDPAGKILEGPIDVTAKARWGERDDPFRTHVNGDIVWAWFEAAGATTLKVARLRSDGMAQCATF